MSYTKIWIHAVWGVKNREPRLTANVRKELFNHIKENARDKGIFIDCINGYMEHVHCLFALSNEHSIAKAMQLIKGESAFWINKHHVVKPKLEWADEYFAVSVSESMKNKVREYIKEQEEHHRKHTYTEEYDEFIKKYGFGTEITEDV